MKDDTSTPITEGDSPNEFERDKPGTVDRSRAEAAIEELRQRGGVFVNAVRATRMPMLLTDPNLPGNPIVFANEAFLKLSGYRVDELMGQQPHFMNGPHTDPKDSARFSEALRSDQDDIIETVQYRKNGSRFVATVLLSAFKDDQGRTLNHFMSWLDVTRRADAEDEVAQLRQSQGLMREQARWLKQAEAAASESEQKARLLLTDLQHRVRNTIAVVRSIARRTADRSENVEEMISHFEGRLNAFARIQAAVTRNTEGSVDLKSIVEDELVAVAAREGGNLKIKGPDLLLRPRVAESISLAIHELATNAIKYGALAASNGRIRVSWKLARKASGTVLNFEWTESGLDTPPAISHEGFGHEMLLRSLPYDLGAETRLEFSADGMCFTMNIPIGPDVLAEPAG